MKNDISLIEGKRLCLCENREYTRNMASLEKAVEDGAVLEGIATVCSEDMSLYVSLGDVTGIIPKNEVAYSSTEAYVKDIAVITRVGKAVCFKVMGVDEDEN